MNAIKETVTAVYNLHLHAPHSVRPLFVATSFRLATELTYPMVESCVHVDLAENHAQVESFSRRKCCCN